MACQPGADCSDSDVSAKKGFWERRTALNGVSSVEIFACPNPEACLGQDKCREGHTGIVCMECASGYSRSVGMDCSKCPASNAAARFFALIFLPITILPFMIWLFCLIKASTARGAVVGPLKAITDFAQIMLTVMTALRPSSAVPKFLALFNGTWGNAAFFQCMFNLSEPVWASARAFLPLAIICSYPLLHFLLWLLSRFVCAKFYLLPPNGRSAKRGNETSDGSIRSYFLRGGWRRNMTVLCYGTWALTFTDTCFLWFYEQRCFTVDGLGSFRVLNPSQPCKVFPAGVVYLVLHLIVFIPLAMFHLWRLKSENHGDGVHIAFRFFSSGYRNSHWYWDFVTFYRRIFVSGVAALITDKWFSRTLIALAQLLLLMAETSVRPWSSKIPSRISTAGYIITILMMYGLAPDTPPSIPFEKTVAAAAIVLCILAAATSIYLAIKQYKRAKRQAAANPSDGTAAAPEASEDTEFSDSDDEDPAPAKGSGGASKPPANPLFEDD